MTKRRYEYDRHFAQLVDNLQLQCNVAKMAPEELVEAAEEAARQIWARQAARGISTPDGEGSNPSAPTN